MHGSAPAPVCRVLIVAGALPAPGRPVGTFVKSQAESLRGLGVEVSYEQIAGRPVVKYLQAMPRVRRRAGSGEFDLIHAHHGFSALTARAQASLPLVVSFLGDELLRDVDPTGRRRRRGLIWYGLSVAVAATAAAVIVKSEEMARKLPFRRRVYVIPNGVNLACFRPMAKLTARLELGLGEQKKYVLFAANPALPVKGFDLAEESLRVLRGGPFGASVDLLTLERVPPHQVPTLMNAAVVVLLTSYSEGSPNVIKEAMACGRPIVSTDVGDVRAVIGRTEGCYVVPRDPVRVSECLARELSIGRPCTTGPRDVAHLEIGLVAQRVLEVYQTVLSDGPRRQPVESTRP